MASGQQRVPQVEIEPEDKDESVPGFFLEAFLLYIKDCIDWRDLLCYHYFGIETQYRKQFRMLENKDDAVQQMLETILERKDWSNRFQYLLELLEETGNEKVLKILQGKRIPSNKEQFKRLVQGQFFKAICDRLEVMEIIPSLIEFHIINEKEAESIRNIVTIKNNWEGAMELVFNIHKHSEFWYPGFILALVKTRQEDLARLLDETLTEKYLKDGDNACIDYENTELTSLAALHSRSCETESNRRDKRMSKLSEDPDHDEETYPKRPDPDGADETEPKQLMSSNFGTLEAAKISFTSHTEISVNNLSPNKPGEEEGSTTSFKPETVRRSLEQSMDLSGTTDSSLDFQSLLMDTENMRVEGRATKIVDRSLGSQNFNLNGDSLSSKDTLDEGLELNSLTEYCNTMNTSKSSLETRDGNEDSLHAAKGKPDFSHLQKLTVSKPKATSPSRDSTGSSGNKADTDSKVFRDKVMAVSEHQGANITEGERGLNIKESVGADHEREEVEDKDISLRHYQEELAAPALQGKNVIIVAPTGSGKTRVAMRIIQEHIRKQQGKGIAKVIFLVNQVALANQQGEACRSLLRKYSSKVITGESQRKSECLKDFIDKRDILVVTAQVLLDGLVRKEISSINCFSLIIFDECHHTHANHTFNQIMGQYMDLKFGKTESALPQIVGLTASVGVGKARNVDKAVDHIKHLMANLDAQVISTVKNNMGELREHVSLPEEETCKVPKREGDKFGESVTLLMNTIERRICQSSLVKEIPEASVLEKQLKAPAQKGSAQYTQWVCKLWRETAKLKNSEARRFLNSCRAHLEHYNNALIIYNDARMEDAIAYLDAEITKWKENAIMDDNESILYGAFKKLRNHRFPKCSNPKLDKLLEMVTKAYAKDPENSRGIVFVKTRDLASAIVRWMTDTPLLRELKPIIFTGTNMSADKGGMTKAAQVDALEYFRNGKHKLIVATSVAEEGLDISKCNLVIRYDHVTNEIAMVQSRGRGRAADSKYYVIAEEKTGMAEKEELNMIREIMMRKAIIQLQEHIEQNTEKFKQEIHKFQDEANLDRQLKSLGRGRKLIRMVGQFELRCIKCDKFICWSDNVKKIQDSHHVVIDDQLTERVSFVKSSTVGFKDDTVQFVGKLICKECGGNLGVICIHRTLEFPVLKIENFLVVDTNGRQSTCKRWKSVPFHVDPLSSEDWKEIVKARKESGES